MSTPANQDLSAAGVISLIESGTYARDVVSTIARGFLPVSHEDLIAILAYLKLHPDPEIAAQAAVSLQEVPARDLFAFAANEEGNADHLLNLLRGTDDNQILEALIRNKAITDEAVIELARTTTGAHVQEVIVINQARILRAPQILDALLDNPALAPDARRRALETKEEFFEKKARLQQLAESLKGFEEDGEPVIAELDLDPIADLLERAAQFDEEAAPPPDLQPEEQEDPKKQAIWTQLPFMTVGEKVQLAFRGDKMVRMILVRERNKLICTSVMRNPRMSEREVESIAGMRNVDEEVLRLIGVRRDWMTKYTIMLTLIKNPKAPVGVVLPFLNRLTLRDLKGLKDDRGVQQVVREMSRKLYIARAQKN